MASGAAAVIIGVVLVIGNVAFGISSTVAAWSLLGLTVLGLGSVVVGVYMFATANVSDVEHAAQSSAATAGSDGAGAEANRALMARYHTMAHTQASSSFRDSRIAMACGLGLLVIAGIYAVLSVEPTQTQIIIAALAALGSAFSAYLSATFIKTHNRAVAQVYYFFGQPLVEGYLLRAEEIAARLMSDTENAPLAKVVDAYLGQASAASALGPWAAGAEVGGQSWRWHRRATPTVDGGSTGEGTG